MNKKMITLSLSFLLSNLNASQEYTILPESKIRENAIHLHVGYGCQGGLRSPIIPPAGTKMSLHKMENLVYRMCKSCADEHTSSRKTSDYYMAMCLKNKNIMIEAMTGKKLDSNHPAVEQKNNPINVVAVIAVPVESQAHEPKSTFFQNGFARWKHDMGIEKDPSYTIEDLMRENAQQGKE